MTLTTRLSEVISCLTRRHNCSFVTGEHCSDGHTGSTSGERIPDVGPSSHQDAPSRSRLLSDHKSSQKQKRRAHFAPDVSNNATESEPMLQEEAAAQSPEGSAGRRGGGSPQPSAHMEPCLGTLDLISLGVGSCLGTGMYLTTGIVAKKHAGPGGVISLLLAGLASGLTGLCYAELAGLCPNTSGSAYMYAYVTVGELVAFVIGWGLVVEYVIGTAAGAVALSQTMDSLSRGSFSFYMAKAAGVFGLPKLDLLAAVVCLLLTLLLASGVRMSARVNNGLNVINMAVFLFFVIASLCLGSSKNWVSGAFFPFGVAGVVQAIPVSYYAYIGFDSVAAAGEEARNPTTSIPRALLLSIALSCVAYVTVILALTFDMPFDTLNSSTAVMDVLAQLKFVPGQYIVAAGAVSGEFAATFGSMFPLPRVLATMAADGLIFRPLGVICPKRHTPLRATFLSGLVAMVMATFFDLKLLIELVLIGTLLAYIMVTFALLYTRYVEAATQPVSRSPETGSGAGTPCDPNHRHRPGERGEGEREDSMELTAVTAAVISDTSEDRGPGAGAAATQPRKKRQARGAWDQSRDSHDAKPASYRGGVLSSIQSALTVSAARVASDKNSDIGESSGSDCDGTVLLFEKPAPASGQDAAVKLLPAEECRPNGAAETGPSGTLGLTGRPKKVRRCSFLRSYFLLSSRDQDRSARRHRQSLRFHGRLSRLVSRVTATRGRVLALLCLIYAVIVVLCVVVAKLWAHMADGSVLALGLLGVLSAILVVMVCVVCFLPQSVGGDSFRAPLVPALPVFVALINIYLITSLSPSAWLMFAIWMGLGLLVYFLYGLSHSQAGGHHYTEILLLPDDDNKDEEDEEEEEEDGQDNDCKESRRLINNE